MDKQKQIEEAKKRIDFLMNYRFESLEDLTIPLKKPIDTLLSIISQQTAEIAELKRGMQRISECGTTGEDAREMHGIAQEFI